LRTIAAENHVAGTTENGINEITQQLNKLSIEQFSIVDGSGLSDQNQMCPKAMVDLLIHMKKEKQFSVFFNSLPVACRSGSLKNIGCKTVLEGSMHAKTGSMKGVRCYAGYILNKKNELIVFCLMINDYNCSSNVIIKEAIRLLESIY